MNDIEYLEQKRLKVLKEIKPICEAFRIKDYDYLIENGRERLKINNTLIGCSANSISAIVEELVGYIFVKIWVKNRWLGHFKTQTLNIIKQYWVEEESE